MRSQPWIFSKNFDLVLIVGPAIITTVVVLLFQNSLTATNEVPPILWLILIVGVDVAHVYSTIFRTYLDKHELQKRPKLYVFAPLLGWIGGCVLYSMGSLYFWRVLAYLAVFHFIRQQYGFMMIYGRGDDKSFQQFKWLDKAAIYGATIYPLIYWHTHQRSFDWFVQGDFISIPSQVFAWVSGVILCTIVLAYLAKEILNWRQTRNFNIPKNLLLFGTAFSWFFGIVYFNNDLVFTATNVIAHGIPYMALIWLFGYNQTRLEGKHQNNFILPWLKSLFSWKAWPLFVFILFVIAYFEEGVWDGLIWRDHTGLFSPFRLLPVVSAEYTLVWLVPFLALPQITHYILDAFIWRLHTKETNWKQVLFHNAALNR
jgi:hypothetical protein